MRKRLSRLLLVLLLLGLFPAGRASSMDCSEFRLDEWLSHPARVILVGKIAARGPVEGRREGNLIEVPRSIPLTVAVEQVYKGDLPTTITMERHNIPGSPSPQVGETWLLFGHRWEGVLYISLCVPSEPLDVDEDVPTWLLQAVPSPVTYQEGIRVLSDGEPVSTRGRLVDGHTVLPMSDLARALRLTSRYGPSGTFWEREAPSIPLHVRVPPRSSDALVSGVLVDLPVPVSDQHGEVWVPLRTLAEAAGASVLWHEGRRIVTIYTPDGFSQPPALRATIGGGELSVLRTSTSWRTGLQTAHHEAVTSPAPAPAPSRDWAWLSLHFAVAPLPGSVQVNGGAWPVHGGGRDLYAYPDDWSAVEMLEVTVTWPQGTATYTYPVRYMKPEE